MMHLTVISVLILIIQQNQVLACETKEAGLCDIQEGGNICTWQEHKVAGRDKVSVAEIELSDACRVQVQLKTSIDRSIQWVVVNLGKHPQKEAYERTYTIDWRFNPGLKKSGYKLIQYSDIDLSVLPNRMEMWTNGELAAEVSENGEGYSVAATCNGQAMVEVDYRVNGGQDVTIIVPDTQGWTGSCYESPCGTTRCYIADNGVLCPPDDVITVLPSASKIPVAQLDLSDTCRMEIVVQSHLNRSVYWVAINVGSHSRGGDNGKYKRSYTFDLWGEEGIKRRGYQIRGPQLIDMRELPDRTETWTGGELSIVIRRRFQRYRVIVTCGGQHLATIVYGVHGGQDVNINVADPKAWTGPCYQLIPDVNITG